MKPILTIRINLEKNNYFQFDKANILTASEFNLPSSDSDKGSALNFFSGL